MHFDINYTRTFFDSPPKVMKIKTKINKWDSQAVINKINKNKNNKWDLKINK